MGILNVTPDSFSDGDQRRVDPASLEHVVALAKQMITDGADILDIGGMSTRPGVTNDSVSEDEEISRVVPVIQALRLDEVNVPISIDTFRPVVAEQAILAGASCINDVRGGREPGMLEMMAKLDVPVVLMHSRGDSVSMSSAQATDYSALSGVVSGVRKETEAMVDRAEAAGIRRWNIVLDPGIGFAKTLEGNMELLRHLPELVAQESELHGLPMLVGASRKGFIGTVTGKKVATEREFGNAAVTSMCCASGVVDIVRVHSVGPTKDVISMWAA